MDVKDRILHKANDLFFRYGVRSITMDEIAAQCGVSKKTIYQFFEDKDALVAAVLDKEIDNTQGRCLDTRNISENAIHEVFLAMEFVIQMFDSMHANVMFDLHKHHPESYHKLEQHKSKFLYTVTKENIERGQQEGLYRTELNAEILAYMRLETVFMTVRQELIPRHQHPPSVVMQEISDHFLYGMATPKGLELIEKYKKDRTNK